MLRGKHRAHIRGRQLRNLNDHNWFNPVALSCHRDKGLLTLATWTPGCGVHSHFWFSLRHCLMYYALRRRHSGGYRQMARVCTCKFSTDTITGKTSLIEGSLFQRWNSCDLSIQSRDQLCPASRGTFVIARSNRGIVCVPCGTAWIS